MPLSPANPPGRLNKDPKILPKFEVAKDELLAFMGSSSTITHPGEAAFWTQVDKYGAVESTSGKTSQYYDVVDISGAGFLTHLIGHVNQFAAFCVFRVTVDGVVHLVDLGLVSTTQRAVLGVLFGTSSVTAVGPQSPRMFNSAATLSADGRVMGALSVSSNKPILPAPAAVIGNGLMSVRFDDSLKVEVWETQVGSTTAQDRNAGCIYVLD